jgi:hypothetical protein
MTRRLLRLPLCAATLLLVEAQAALAQTLGQGSDPDISLWRVAASLLLCAGLAVAGGVILKARSGQMPAFRFAPRRQRRLKLVETLGLGRDTAISIVDCDGREMLVLTSPQGSRVVDELPRHGGALALSPEHA